MVFEIHVALEPEEILGIPQVLFESLRHGFRALEETRVGIGPRPGDRILRIEQIEGDITVLGVDHRLHRITQVIDVRGEV